MADKKQALCLSVIVALTIIAYANTLKVPFIYDDFTYVVENTAIRQLIPSWSDYSLAGQTRLHLRPVAVFTFRLNYQVSQLSSWSYHLVNIAIHALSGCLLFLLIRRLAGARRKAGAAATMLAAAAAALWVVHPLAINGVTYISGRFESLGAFFFLASLVCFLRWQDTRVASWKWACVVSVFAAVGCKESLAGLPLAIFLLDRFVLRKEGGAVLPRRLFYALIFGSWVFLGLLILGSRWFDWIAEENSGALLVEHFQMSCVAIIHYIRLVFWPAPLVFEYGYWPVPEWWEWVPAALALAAAFLTGLVLLMRRGSLAGYATVLFFLLQPPLACGRLDCAGCRVLMYCRPPP